MVLYRSLPLTRSLQTRWAVGLRGVHNGGGKWFQFCWPSAWEQVNITVKELSCSGGLCSVGAGGSIRVLCDNTAVVAIIKVGTSIDPLVMHLMRCLFFFTVRYQLILLPKHLPGRENLAADHLSRDALSFRQVVPHAKVEPTLLPESRRVTASRLDIGELERCVAFFFSHGLASQKTYRSEENQYIKFCSSAGAAPLPVTEQQFANLCLTKLTKLKNNTIKTYLSGVRYIQL